MVLNMTGPYLLTVTGSIAAGKSTVCRHLQWTARQRGIPFKIVDVDKIRASLLENRCKPSNARLQEKLRKCFGDKICARDGTISRRRLSDIVFHDRGALKLLNEILDPPLVSAVVRSLDADPGITVLDWALIAEKKLLWLTEYNALLVTCSFAAQSERLFGHDLPKKTCRRRIALQFPPQKKEAVIRAVQEEAGRGDFYRFETTSNPNVSAYTGLFSEILANAVHPPQGRAA